VVKVVVPKRFREQEKPSDVSKKTPRRRGEAPPVIPATPAAVPEVRIRPERPPLVDFLYASLRPLYEILLMASFIPFLVYFMLSWRDHLHRSFLRLFHDQERLAAGRSLQGISDMVRAFVAGNFLLGLLLAVVSSVLFWILRLPYFLLIGPLSGFFSLVPYIGLPLAMLPPMLAGLSVYNRLPAYLILAAAVAFLHLLALNLLYPKLVGSRVHLNPLVVTVALMFWGTLWGAVGLMLAIPMTAAIKAVCDNVESLAPYGKLLGD
jgi:predicted PurR-regulated permease PerM